MGWDETAEKPLEMEEADDSGKECQCVKSQ
jgi:hypothetical protein